ncbi:MAG: FAD-dependent thymidylate synthase [Candidatus Aminicenantales bacterium]
MKVILAGYNVDREVIDELKRNSPSRLDVTPETLSASYARISRDPRPADELRRAARQEVERARRSNQNIIFKMGHHSVAEHAVFNFDLIGVSRLAIEEVEKFRLCSYTEKSQRYITLGDDFVLPEEIKNAGREKLYVETIRAQNALYHSLYSRLQPYFFDRNPEMAGDSKKHSILDGWAKEDARYVVSLATEGQLGMTINARNLELLIRRLASKKLAEVRELNRRMYDLAKEVAPSILLFTEASDLDVRTYAEFEEEAERVFGKKNKIRKENSGDIGPRNAVHLVDFTRNGDEKLLASILHTTSSLPYQKCLAQVKELSFRAKKGLIQRAFQHMEFYDFPLREFEYVDLTFDITLSASCFAQLKRHRMATLTCQRYNPELGVTVPPSIEDIGAAGEFMEMVGRTNDVYGELKKTVGQAAEYILTNAHQRRALLKVNARELYHISRLREDATAQWDIRELSGKMSRLARKVLPLSCLLLGGKDTFPGLYESVFGRKPKFLPPDFRE